MSETPTNPFAPLLGPPASIPVQVFKRMDPDRKAAWVAALRSGEFKQTQSVLYDAYSGGYCCLGVNLKIAGYEPNFNESGQCFPSCEALDQPSPDLNGYRTKGWKIATGVDLAAIERLADMNDSGIPFHVIADWIEVNL